MIVSYTDIADSISKKNNIWGNQELIVMNAYGDNQFVKIFMYLK